MSEEPVTIVDREVLKVLSAETRMDILKLLSEGEGGRTPSFVAKKLGKSDATIIEHLQALEKVHLVKKTVAPGKKWVFYSLTERGSGIVSSKSRRLVIILATSLLSLTLGVGTFVGHIYTSTMQGAPMAAERAAETALGEAKEMVPAAGILVQPILLHISIVLLAISIAGLGFYFYKKSRFEEGVI